MGNCHFLTFGKNKGSLPKVVLDYFRTPLPYTYKEK